jgi:hypothetical protein
VYIGYTGAGQLFIDKGATVSSQIACVGGDTTSIGQVTIDGRAADGTPSTWTIANSLYLGGTETAGGNGSSRMFVVDGGEVDVGQTLKFWSGKAYLAGGTLRFHNPFPIINGTSSNFIFSGGTVAFDCDLIIGEGQSQVTESVFFGSSMFIRAGRNLTITGQAMLLQTVPLDYDGTLVSPRF